MMTDKETNPLLGVPREKVEKWLDEYITEIAKKRIKERKEKEEK